MLLTHLLLRCCLPPAPADVSGRPAQRSALTAAGAVVTVSRPAAVHRVHQALLQLVKLHQQILAATSRSPQLVEQSNGTFYTNLACNKDVMMTYVRQFTSYKNIQQLYIRLSHRFSLQIHISYCSEYISHATFDSPCTSGGLFFDLQILQEI